MQGILMAPDLWASMSETDRVDIANDACGTEHGIIELGPKHWEHLNVLFWGVDLAHEGSQISATRARKRVITHYCPAEVIATYVDSSPNVALKSHGGVAYYTTSH
jgi:hypothetical protein